MHMHRLSATEAPPPSRILHGPRVHRSSGPHKRGPPRSTRRRPAPSLSLRCPRSFAGTPCSVLACGLALLPAGGVWPFSGAPCRAPASERSGCVIGSRQSSLVCPLCNAAGVSVAGLPDIRQARSIRPGGRSHLITHLVGAPEPSMATFSESAAWGSWAFAKGSAGASEDSGSSRSCDSSMCEGECVW